MKRRDMLKVLAGLPLAGLVGEAKAAVDTRPLWIQQGEQMCRNLDRLYADRGWPEMSKSTELASKAINYRLCEHMANWDISQPFADHDPVLCRNPSIDFEVTTKQGIARKLRTFMNLQALDDMRAFHGIDAEAELIDGVGMEAALEIQMEVRRAPEPITSYRIYTLLLSPSLIHPEDFTIRRGVRIYYTKS